MEVGVPIPMVNIKINGSQDNIAKQLPQYTRKTEEILPYVENWLEGQEDRFKRKVLKIFENAAVNRRYSIMDADEVFRKTSSASIIE